MPDSRDVLYTQPLAAGRQGPLYNAFSYPTKISAESIALFIACHTAPGDLVLDVFGGSGTTGIAALLCERPTPKMLAMAADAGLEPVWGPRRATIYELSEIGSLVGRVLTHAPDPQQFTAAAERLVAAAEAAEPQLYSAAAPDGQAGVLRHVIWSDVVRCPRCGDETTYGDVRVRYKPLRFSDQSTCDACGFVGEPDAWVRVTETIPDPWTGTEVTRRARVPWRVYGRSSSGNWSRPAIEADKNAEIEALAKPLPAEAPIATLTWGDLYRSGYHQGMTHLHHLYTARNFRALAVLWGQIENEPEPIRDALRLLALSYNATHSTLMTRVVLKKNSTDFILTGAQSGVLYVSGIPVEKNVFAGLRRKIGVFQRAFTMLHGTIGSVDVVTGSSTGLRLPDQSVDYVFTDPPFGGYIPYSEINQINELWLGRPTATEAEAIMSPAQGKGLPEYQALLTAVFKEMGRAMKPEAEATVVFHSAHASVWQALTASLSDAGLAVTAASILDKTQASFKQVNGHVAVSGDPLLRVQRAADNARLQQPSRTLSELVSDLADDVDQLGGDRKKRNERLYSQVVGRALVDGVPVTLDAQKFYAARIADGSR